jgi:hypothetical protein
LENAFLIFPASKIAIPFLATGIGVFVSPSDCSLFLER